MSMWSRAKHIYDLLSGFFPVQLLFLHLRRSLLLLVFWLVLFGTVSGFIFRTYGVPFLFLEPEYLGQVNIWSFFITGLLLGLFVMAFHISSYIFYSYRFPFLATLTKPLYRFSINNSTIPFLFYLFYAWHIFVYHNTQGVDIPEILLYIIGLFLGSFVTISLVFTYFFSTLRPTTIEAVSENLEKPLKFLIKKDRKIPMAFLLNYTQTYLRNFHTIRPARSVLHYPIEELTAALQKHHVSAAMFFVFNIFLLVGLSIFSQNPIFQIPAGASILLLLTMYLMVTGAFFSRFKTWTYFLGVVLLIIFNFISGLEPFQKTHYAFGMEYKQKAPYTLEHFAEITNDSILAHDKARMLNILNNWRDKFPENAKPKMVIVNTSGGGMRSSLWTLGVLQKLDSLTGGQLYDQTFLISGSSGGMIGAAYYRELVQNEREGKVFAKSSQRYFNQLGEDMLNPIGFSLAVNDFFIPLRRVKTGGLSYPTDRGYSFEAKLTENTDSLLAKPIIAYRELEERAEMPIMILAPTIINDGRRLMISAQDISFLTTTSNNFVPNVKGEKDGVELRRLFAQNRADSLWLTTALRMSATFPYITPLVSLPSEPRIEVIDAGARDNSGFKLSLRFLYEYKDWITKNTSGVVFVQILANRPEEVSVETSPYRTRFDAMVKPIGGVVTSFSNLQEFSEAEALYMADSWVDFPLEVLRIPLLTTSGEISLSWHLTPREKTFILRMLRSERLLGQYLKLSEILNENHAPSKKHNLTPSQN